MKKLKIVAFGCFALIILTQPCQSQHPQQPTTKEWFGDFALNSSIIPLGLGIALRFAISNAKQQAVISDNVSSALHLATPFAIAQTYPYALQLFGLIRPLSKSKFPHLHQALKLLCKKANVATPRLMVTPYHSSDFAAGLFPYLGTIVLAEHDLETLTPQEIIGIMGHELAHLKHYHMVKSIIFNEISSKLIDKFMLEPALKSQQIPDLTKKLLSGSYIIYHRLKLVGIDLDLLSLAQSRYHEYQADKTGGKLSSSKDLAAALQRVSEKREEPSWFGELFSTHPVTSKRIERLEKQAKAESAGFAIS